MNPTAGEVMRLISGLDGLYQDVVAAPDRWDEAAFAEWMADVAGAGEGPLDRRLVRELRRGVRAARKLQAFCAGGRAVGTSDWRSVVDQALGSTAWSPGLEMARIGLNADPSEEVFDEVKDRFRVVHFTPWMEGVQFEEWMADR